MRHTVWAIAVLLAALHSATRADVYSLVYQHAGNADPLGEGWTLLPGDPGSEISVGPINDSGVEAWTVDDDATYVGGYCMYRGLLTVQDLQHAEAGWMLRVRFRMPDTPELPLGSPMVRFRDGDRSYQIHFGSEANGDPVARLIYTSSSYILVTLDGLGGGHHVYEMEYSPNAGAALLRVDGVLVAEGYTGFAHSDSAPRVAWGAGSSGDVGQGHFALVEFHVASNVGVSGATWAGVKSLYR